MLYHLSDYRKLGSRCKQLDAGIPVLNAIIVELNYKMVCPGCGWYNNGKCLGFRELSMVKNGYIERVTEERNNMLDFVEKLNTRYEPTLTNKEIAEKLGITKRQVSKLRKEGKLAQVMEK